MTSTKHAAPPWLPGLMSEVEAALKQQQAGAQDLRPALEAEFRQLQEKSQGWSLTLGNSKLSPAVRTRVESEWNAALERQQEIETDLAQMDGQSQRVEQLVATDQVVVRLDRLDQVLAANDPTRGNLELSLHIDRITCYRDDRVQLRMCKLGIAPDAVEVLAAPVVKPVAEGEKTASGRARRRAKLRVIDDDAEIDLRAQADFIADVDRFAGLGDEWFWTDEFTIPVSSSWASENAETVFRRRKESQLPYSKLAKEFGVTSPTIGAAIRIYLAAHPDESDIKLQRGGKRKPKFDLASFCDEARQLWIEDWSKEKLAKKYGCSAPTVGKAIAFAYERDGLPMPTREEVRRAKVIEARRLLDGSSPLEVIASLMKTSSVTVRDYLRESFAAEGRSMPDLRRKPPNDAA